MSTNDPVAACQRLVRLFERSKVLQERGRLSTDDSVRLPLAEFVLAQLRMRIAPALDPRWPEHDPVHLALFGGTNTGKSTVLNVLLGRPAAGMGVLARFSQHPEGYRTASADDGWLSAFPTRFQGYRRFQDASPPRQTDAELRLEGYRPCFALFDINRINGATSDPCAPGTVFWDAPDFSTEESLLHLGTVLDVAALADVVVLTMTDESYADDRGHALLRLVKESGVALHVVANKLPEPVSPALLDDIVQTLRVSARVAAPVHRLSQSRGADPAARLAALLPSSSATALREALQQEIALGVVLKQRALAGALNLIEHHWHDLLRPLAAEAERGVRWGETVARVTNEAILDPYRREYLEGLSYADFNRALARLMQLLQVPWIGPALDFAGRIVRWPSKFLISAFRRLSRASETRSDQPPERKFLDEAIERWLTALKAEAELEASRENHPAWTPLIREIESPRFRASLRERFDSAFRSYQAELETLVRSRADSLYAKLKESPKRLNALRVANLAANVLSVGFVVHMGGLNWWDVVLGPAVVALNQSLVERGFGKVLESQRTGLKEQQFQSVSSLVADHLELPARDLFQGGARADDLLAARRDFAVVHEAATLRLQEAAHDG